MSKKNDPIVQALEAHQAAKLALAEDNPLADRKLEDLQHSAGILKSSDKHPVKNMAPEGALGFDLEASRFSDLASEKAAKVNLQRARQRAQAERKAQIDKIEALPFKPEPKRMEAAWLVIYPMVPIIEKIALSKQRWAARFLGSVTDDLGQVAMEKTAIVLAKSSHNLDDLQIAANQLGEVVKRKNQVPGDQLTDEERAEKKRDRRNRKFLMGLVNNRVMGALVDIYTNEHNLKWESLDLIATVMANINGVGDDPMISRFKADRAPAFMGTRFQSPGGIDPALLTMAVTGAITDMGLDPIVEILLNEDNRRVDGAVKWTACARDIFLATPDGTGEWMWSVVEKATESHKNPRKRQGDAARTHTRNLFEWMPLLIGNVVDSFDPYLIGWSPTGRRAVMASDFELFYLPEPKQSRDLARPALKFTSVKEAAQILAEQMALLTNEDYVQSLVHN